MEDIEITFKGSLSLEERYSQLKSEINISKTVFVVDSELSYGMARMMQTMLDGLGHEAEIERKPGA